MEKISDDPVCFVARLKEVMKYGLCPLGQLKKNPGKKSIVSEKSGRGEE